MKLAIGLLSFAVLGGGASAQSLPVLHTNTRSIDVRDGHNLYKAYWTVAPEIAKDVYFAHRFRGTSRITFYSDVDSLSFEVTPRHKYDFLIVLDQKDTSFTEVSTIRSSYYKDCGGCTIASDTIPFTLGNDNRIYVMGRVNGSGLLKLFFDDGADNTVLFPSALAKGATLNLDGSIENRATGGTETRKTSDSNDLAIARLKWHDEQVMFVDKQIGEGDGSIGYDVFEDKVIEVDYDRRLMIIHDRPPRIGKGYAEFRMRLNGGEVPSIPGTLISGDRKITADFLFDMGATGCLFLNQGLLAKNDRYGTMKIVGESQATGAGSGVIQTSRAIRPGFAFGHHTFRDVPVNLESPRDHDPGTGTLGMDILKRFHTILDYQNNVIWLKPDDLISAPFRQ